MEINYQMVDLIPIPNVNPITRKTTMQARSYGTCNCALTRECVVSAGIYQTNELQNRNRTYVVPKFFLGCHTIEALLLSTLECFYDLSCMLTIHNQSAKVASKPFVFSALKKNLNQPNEKIELIINRLMVDQWFSNYSFSLYYDRCSPSLCTFEYEGHQHFGYVITIIVSIYGGLSLGLEILIWIGLRFIEQMMLDVPSRLVIWHSVKRMFTFNNNDKIIHRLHFVLVIIMLYIFYSITAFNLYTKTVEIRNITLSKYKDLSLKQSYNSLQCPCSKMSIKYKSFLQIEPRFHQICSSDFVSNEWITYLYNLSIHLDDLFQLIFIIQRMDNFNYCSRYVNYRKKQ